MHPVRRKLCRSTLIAALLSCVAINSWATTDPTVTMPLLGSKDSVKTGYWRKTSDIKYFTLTTLQQQATTTHRINNLVGVGIEEQNTMYIPTDFSVTVHLEITKYDSNHVVIETITDKAFTVTYNKTNPSKYNSFVYYAFTNAYEVKVKIISIDSGIITWPVSKVLRVENQLTATRDYPFNCDLATDGLGLSHDVIHDELKTFWTMASINTNPGITEYDLEWAWIDESAIDRYKSGSNYVQALIFNNNATRVSISASHYDYNIPLLYDDTGKIFVRIRPVQLKNNGQRIEGKWSWIYNDPNQPVTSTVPVNYNYLGHEEKLNWQASTSFAEEGKRKSVVQYFDGSLRSRQTVTKNNVDSTTVVAESFYDYQGRAVIQVLPAPTLNTAIAFAHNFNQAINPSVNANEYPKWVYDKLETGASVCGNPATPFSTNFGTANYYSAQNPLPATDPLRKYIPDATGNTSGEAYSFTETRLSPDGRIAAQGGVGITHQIGSKHETKYFYESPDQVELDALFGTDAGEASHYFKNIVQDANGQYSISYTDMYGRTVATALAGGTPKIAGTNNPMLEALDSQGEAPIVKQLLDKETNRVIGNSIISSKSLVVLKDNNSYNFSYTLNPEQLSLLACSINGQPAQPVCYDCIYNLKISINSDCNGVSGFPYVVIDSNFTIGADLNNPTCNTANPGKTVTGFNKNFSLNLPEGSYTITKVLSLSDSARNIYRNVFLRNDTCKKFVEFYTEELAALQAASICNMTCASCTTALGGNFAGYKAKFLAASGMTTISPEMEIELQASFNESMVNCNRLCNNNDGMDLVRSTRQIMLQDVTPPYGQYAKLNDNSQSPPILYQNNNYNIFKVGDPSNVLEGYGGSSARIDYKFPIKFESDDITLLSIGKYYDEFGRQESFDPAPVSPDRFVDSFKTSWADQLLVHHPEFKKLQLSENQLKTSYQFEADLENDSTWLQAVSHNYITNLINLDPFFSGVGLGYKTRMLNGYYNGSTPPPGGNNLNTDPIVNGINSYLKPHNMPPCVGAPVYAPDFASMWQVALGAIYCRDKANGDPCNVVYSDLSTKAGCLMNPAFVQPQNTFSEGCATDRDWAWKVFKTLYLAERRKLISAYLNTQAPSFPTGSMGNNNIPPYQLRFINHANPSTVFANLGINGAGEVGEIINILNNGGTVNNVETAAGTLASNQYDSVCRGYVATWLMQLKSCPQINAIYEASLVPPVTGGPNPTIERLKWVSDSTWLMDRLRGICFRGSDVNHFMGSSSVKPGNPLVIGASTYTQFSDVVDEFLQTRLTPTNPGNIPPPYTDECYPWLISVPAPYDKQTPVANSYVLSKPSDCECTRINSVLLEYQTSGFVGTFSAYMQYQHGTYISQEQLDALTSLCSNPVTYQCKLLEKPIALPPALQCRGISTPAPKTCITCQDYAGFKSDFYTIFNQHAPFVNPQNQIEVNYNHVFARYVNYRTGFTKTWTEYVAFQNTCDSSGNPISCGSLDSTLNEFYLSPEYQQYPSGPACRQAFVNYFNTRYNVVYSYAQWMALFAQCGSTPNVCNPTITCASFGTLVNGFYNQNGVQIYNNPNCQSLFVSYINTQLSSNYTYSQLEAIYNYTCNVSCGLEICQFPNHFLLTRVYNQFKIDNPFPWNLPNCQQAFADYFNNYFGLSPALDLSTILGFYPIIDRQCTPDIYSLCSPPYSCNDLSSIRAQFLANPDNQPIEQLPNCQQKFADFFNAVMGTSYTYAQIEALYLSICGTALNVCEPTIDCRQLISFVQYFIENKSTICSPNEECEVCFVNYFNTQYGTSYTAFSELAEFYSLHCGYNLSVCNTMTDGGVIISAESFNTFVNNFKTSYPDPSTQLGSYCQNYFGAKFNGQFGTAYTLAEIAAYYLQQTGNVLEVCSSQCSEITDFINNFASQYSSLKLPLAAREDLFTFAYNNLFLKGADEGLDGSGSGDDGDKKDPKAFNPVVNYITILQALAECGYTDFNLNTATAISINNPQVLLSLKQVYYIIHPNGLPDECQADFQSWFNRVMQTQYEYSDLVALYNSICGNNAGNICEDGSAVAEIGFGVGFGAPNPPVFLPPLLCGLNEPGGGPVVYNDDPCKDLPKIAFHFAMEKYELYLDSLRNVFDTAYYNKCIRAKDLESFTVSYNTSEYHYTLYYYDQSGNLVKTVPPAGVNKLNASEIQTVKTYRANVLNGQPEASNKKTPVHTLFTEYRYNTLNQVIAQKTPDAGISNFWYDRLGRLVVSRNAKQQSEAKYSYTVYDDLGRIKEVGQKPHTILMSQTISRDEFGPNGLRAWLANTTGGGIKEQITRTVYDEAYSLICNSNSSLSVLCQKNLRNRVSYTYIKNSDITSDPNYFWNSATFFSYDIHGNVDTLVQDYGSSLSTLSANAMNSAGTGPSGSRWKKIVYEYDLISGKVNQVSFQPEKTDAFYHKYSYDAENRVTLVETSTDKLVWEKDARYNYYKHGTLARVNLGELQVQGIDYAYTLQGWLKGVNSTSVHEGIMDIGQDGKIGSANNNVARDAYGFSLNYFAGDYKPVGGVGLNTFAGNTFNLTNSDNNNVAAELFNGNIAAMLVNIPKLSNGDAYTYGYRYDQLNRIVSMDAFTGLNNVSNIFTAVASANYKERVSYDANGNIKTYLRNGDAARQAMDNMAYSYKPASNQLDKVVDAAADDLPNYSNYNDIKQGQTNGNYQYDAIGNLTQDRSEGLYDPALPSKPMIEWNAYGKISKITKITSGVTTVINYTYDASCNRISKEVIVASTSKTTWYVRDAGGNVMSIFTKDATINSGDLTQTELYLYGSSRLGVLNTVNNVQNPAANPSGITTFERGNKFFELSNHLSNVLITISDKKFAHDGGSGVIDYYDADIVTATDNFPGGMTMPGREYSNGGTDYRYSINGQEKEQELNENITSAEFWMYDSRLGRRWNYDPKPNVSESPYLTFGGNPISNSDIKGDTIFRPAHMPHTFDDPLKMVLYKTPLGKQLLDEYSKSSTENIYFYAFVLDEKSNKNFKEDNQAIMNTVDDLNAKDNVNSKGEVVIKTWDAKQREAGEQQLRYLNATGYNFDTKAVINIIGLNNTDNKNLGFDKYDLAFAMYHEIYAHVKLGSLNNAYEEHHGFGNTFYTKGMGLYSENIVGGSLMIQGSQAWKFFRQLLELKIKNGDGSEQNKKDLETMTKTDADAAKAAADAKKKKVKKDKKG